MRLITFFLLGLFVASLPVCAEQKFPFLNVQGEFFTNVTVLKVTATDVYFTYARGMANAKLKDLEPEIQKQFRYDPVKAGDAQKNQAATKQPVPAAPKPKAAAQAKPGANDEPVIRVPKLYARSFMNGPAPSFVVEKWLTPKPDMTGKFVLIDFWATWCGPCRQSIPHLNKLSAKYKDKLVVVGLSDETEQDVRAMRSPKIDYNVAIDTQERMIRDVEVKGIPHAILLDPNGIVRFEGMPDYLTEAGLERILTKYSN